MPVQLSFTGSFLGDPTQRSTRAILVTVQEGGGSESDSETDDDKGAPGVPPVLLGVALVAVAFGMKRRGKA